MMATVLYSVEFVVDLGTHSQIKDKIVIRVNAKPVIIYPSLLQTAMIDDHLTTYL